MQGSLLLPKSRLLCSAQLRGKQKDSNAGDWNFTGEKGQTQRLSVFSLQEMLRGVQK